MDLDKNLLLTEMNHTKSLLPCINAKLLVSDINPYLFIGFVQPLKRIFTSLFLSAK